MATQIQFDDAGNVVEPGQAYSQPQQQPQSIGGNREVGFTRVTIGGSEAVEEHGTVQRITESDIYNERQDGSILATARNAAGSPTTTLTPKTIVTIPGGMQVELSMAERLNYVKRSASGDYIEIGQGTQQAANAAAQSQQQVAPEVEAEELFAGEYEGYAANALSVIPSHAQDAMIATVLQKGFDAVNWNDSAYTAGTTPEELRQRVELVGGLFSAQAGAAIERIGGIPEDVYEWAREHAREELQAAMRDHVYKRTTKGYTALADKWMRAIPPTAERLAENGYKVGKSGKQDVVFIDGTWVSVAAAARMGLI